MISNLSTVYERSIQKAEEKGRTEERIQLARKLSQMGVDFDFIAKTLDMPSDEVSKLLQ